jgi:hypothetical protein
MISDHDHLLLVRQINPDDRIRDRDQLTKPNKTSVPIAIPPGHTTTVSHERPPSAMGHQARQAHQEDVPTSRTDTQNVFLCRCPAGRHTVSGHAATGALLPMLEPTNVGTALVAAMAAATMAAANVA